MSWFLGFGIIGVVLLVLSLVFDGVLEGLFDGVGVLDGLFDGLALASGHRRFCVHVRLLRCHRHGRRRAWAR